MASYLELATLESDPNLLHKLEVAVWVAINTIAGEPAATPHHAARVNWAKNAAANSRTVAQQVLRIALAANVGLTVAQIQSAADAGLQTVVNNSINLLAGIGE